MSEARNCRRCGKLFGYMGGTPICPECRKQDEEDFKRVKEYLYQNPMATLSQVSTELDVNVEKIRRYLKDGRLEIVSEGGNMILECEKCGKAIKTGRYCDECERDLSREFQSAADNMRQSKPGDSDEKRRSDLRYLHKRND